MGGCIPPHVGGSAIVHGLTQGPELRMRFAHEGGDTLTDATFEEFFRRATGGHDPYPFQIRLATCERLPNVWILPTGTGKTATAILTWLWRRRGNVPAATKQVTPRRLVYCLPMRSLVEQTYRVAWHMLDRLGELGHNSGPPGDHPFPGEGNAAGASAGAASCSSGVRLHYLLGGHSDDDWTLYPEADMILIGTQDMLLSRGLNRGYGMSRFRWPVAFGLLNSDVLWVNDEVQLMDVGLTTTAQLAGLRVRFGTVGAAQTIWMSATLQTDWLETADHRRPEQGDVFFLSHGDRQDPRLGKRLEAPKVLEKLVLGETDKPAEQLAEVVRAHHRRGSLTLVVLNTVERAQSLYRVLAGATTGRSRRAKRSDGGRLDSNLGDASAPEVLLLHSRFRPPDRRRLESRLRAPVDPAGPGRIVVATQVVEAGVDISARTMVTEIAPWASMVQRFGRCNRFGDDRDARVYWLDVPDKQAAPYQAFELADSRERLASLEKCSVAAADLPELSLRQPVHDALRAKDLLDLFDTTPDLSGNDIDVSRFIRDAVDLDVQVFWRNLPESGPERDHPQPLPSRDELCAAPLSQLDDLIGKGHSAWVWDHLGDRWAPATPRDVRPGVVFMLPASAGLYSEELGWDATVKSPVAVQDDPGRNQAEMPEAAGSDPDSLRSWQTLSEHTDLVVSELEAILSGVAEGEPWAGALRVAARHHDWGKAHDVFQNTMERTCDPSEWAARNGESRRIWAKSGGSRRPRHMRPHFRHELASALALLQHGAGEMPARELDLAAYLVASHHGRIRTTIRSLPGEEPPPGCDDASRRRYAFGVWDGDSLPDVNLGGGLHRPRVELSLELMELGRRPDGRPSWVERTLGLRNAADLGPFRLAYLEALLRAADARASVRTDQHGREPMRGVRLGAAGS